MTSSELVWGHTCWPGPECSEWFWVVLRGPECSEWFWAVLRGPECSEGFWAVLSGSEGSRVFWGVLSVSEWFWVVLRGSVWTLVKTSEFQPISWIYSGPEESCYRKMRIERGEKFCIVSQCDDEDDEEEGECHMTWTFSSTCDTWIHRATVFRLTSSQEINNNNNNNIQCSLQTSAGPRGQRSSCHSQ